MSRSWLVCRTRRPVAAGHLVCFAHSGGAIGEYLRWGDETDDIEVWGVQLPGRAARLAEDPLTRIEEIVTAIVNEAIFPAGAAFFGHSLGALVAFEVTRALRDQGREGPPCLFLSSLPAPHLPLGVAPTEGMSDEALLASLSGAYASVAEEVRADPDLLELVLPGLRADIDAAAAYRYREGPPIASHFVVMGGEEDAIAAAELEAWSTHTTGPFELHRFPGGHFWFRPDESAVVSLVRRVMIHSSSA